MTGNTLDSTLTQTPRERQTSSRYLIDEQPLEFLPSLAEVIGVNEAIFLQKLHWWLRGSRHVRKGRRWIWNTYAQWHQQFRFWCETTIRRIVVSLKRLGLIETENFNRNPADRTMWYTINYEAVAALPTASHLSPQAASSCVQVGQMECPEWTDGVSNLDTLPENYLREVSAETFRKERERTRAQEVERPAPQRPEQDPPPRLTPTWAHRMPADYTPSDELRAELEDKYPLLHFEEEMESLHDYEYQTPKSDWDAATRLWFRRGEVLRKEKATAIGKDNDGHPRRHPTTSTDRRTQEILRQRQAALEAFNTHRVNQAAMDVNFEDITNDTQPVSGLFRSVNGGRFLLPQPGEPRLCRPPVF